MINIPTNFQNNPFCDRKFKELIKFFNELEEKLQHPNCSEYEDQIRELKLAQTDLIKWGIL